MKCSMCSVDIPKARYTMGYSVCVKCSTEEKKLGHIVYPHKTGAYIQVVDKETHDNLNRLDRRGYKSRSAKHYKEFKVSTESTPRKKFRESTVNSIKHIPYNTVKQSVLDYYDEWGYEPTLKYLRQLNSNGDIPLTQRVQLQDLITDMYMTPSPRALRHSGWKLGVL